ETDWHRDLMLALIQILKAWYAGDPRTYVSGNLLIFYVPGNRRRHVSPDVFVVKRVPKHDRPNYLVWEEGKGPDLGIELTSSSTRAEEVKQKFRLYQDPRRVQESFLSAPRGDYLDPPLQGYRLWRGKYVAVRPVKGRLPSKVLGLHLERDGRNLRLYDPATGGGLPAPAGRVCGAAGRPFSTARVAISSAADARPPCKMEARPRCLPCVLAVPVPLPPSRPPASSAGPFHSRHPPASGGPGDASPPPPPASSRGVTGMPFALLARGTGRPAVRAS